MELFDVCETSQTIKNMFKTLYLLVQKSVHVELVEECWLEFFDFVPVWLIEEAFNRF